METKAVQSAVEKVVCDVLENMYFMFPEVLEQAEADCVLPDAHLRATVGVKNGSAVFAFYASDVLVGRMAKNLLGVDQDLKNGELADVFKETANMIAGNLVTELAFDADVNLEVPVVERSGGGQNTKQEEDKYTACSFFTIDDEPFKVSVLIP